MQDKNLKQENLFGWSDFDVCKEEWLDMPEFVQENLEPKKTLYVHFDDLVYLEEFSKLVNQKITEQTKYIWFPKSDNVKPSDYKYIDFA